MKDEGRKFGRAINPHARGVLTAHTRGDLARHAKNEALGRWSAATGDTLRQHGPVGAR